MAHIETLFSSTVTNTPVAEDDTLPSYYIGAAMGLLAAFARSAHYVTCSVLYKQKASNTLQMIIFTGFGFFPLLSFASSAFDPPKNLNFVL